MTIITRKRSDQFAIIPNAVASDDRLTFEERGVLVYLLAKPHDWNVSVKNLQNEGGIGRDKVYRILQKLEQVGYLKREQTKSSDGRFGAYNYTVHDDAVPESLPLPRPENQEAVGPCPENQEAASPLPENPVTGPPVNGKCDTYKGLTKTITESSPLTPKGEEGRDFDIFWSSWPEQSRPDNREVASRLFCKLEPDVRSKVLGAAEAYRIAMVHRNKPARMILFLRDRLWVEFDGAPPLDSDGNFYITPDRPEWREWLGSIRREYGEAGVQTAVKHKFMKRKTRWPADLSLAKSVTNLATSATGMAASADRG